MTMTARPPAGRGRPTGTDLEDGAMAQSAGMVRVSWSAILAGVASAIGLQILFILLGLAIGLGTIDPTDGSGSISDAGTGGYIYWIVTSIMSSFAGGCVAGRLAGVPTMPAAVIHGIVVWATVTILTVWLALSSVSSVASGTMTAVGQAGDTLTGAISEAAEAVDLPDGILPSQLTNAIGDELTDRDLTPQQIRDEASAIIDSVFSQVEQRRAAQIVEDALAEMARSPGDMGSDIQNAIDRLGNVISGENRDELVAQIGQRFDVPPAQAERIVANWEQRLAETYRSAADFAEETRSQTMQAIDNATEALSEAAYWATLASFLGLLAAALGALVSRPDELLAEDVMERHHGEGHRHGAEGATRRDTTAPRRDDRTSPLP